MRRALALLVLVTFAPTTPSFAQDGTTYVLVNDLTVKGLVRVSALPGTEPLPVPADATKFVTVLAALGRSDDAAEVRRHFCNPVDGAFASLAHVWLSGCSGIDLQARTGRDPKATYQRLWLRKTD